MALSAMVLFHCQGPTPQKAVEPEETARNVILLIGDGMGLSQISASFYFNEGPSNFERFPYIGLINTSASNRRITDSAAGATAFASGVKSYNGAIGVGPDTMPVTTVVELVSERGLGTGIIASSSITHATPACFFAHVKSRSLQEDIAAQLPGSGVDFFAGGGWQFFARRSDNANYLDRLASAGFQVDTMQLPDDVKLDPSRKYGFLLAPDGLPRMLDGRGDFLPRATELAIGLLSDNPEGFFLMVEGSQIDWGGHENDAEYLVSEMLDFDRTVGIALDFAQRDGSTLVIVTADHETGGFTLSSTPVVLSNGQTTADYDQITGTFSTGGHSSTLIPVFAYGPGAEKFAGVYQNTDVFHRMLEAAGW